jgi:hypothetical protein
MYIYDLEPNFFHIYNNYFPFFFLHHQLNGFREVLDCVSSSYLYAKCLTKFFNHVDPIFTSNLVGDITMVSKPFPAPVCDFVIYRSVNLGPWKESITLRLQDFED